MLTKKVLYLHQQKNNKMNKFNLKNFLVENKLTKNSKVIEEKVEEVIEEVTEETTVEEVEIPLEEEETVEGNYEKTEAEEPVAEEPVAEEEVYEGTWEDIETDEVAVETLNKIIADHGLKQVQGYFEIAEDKVTQHYFEEIVGKFGLEAVKDWIKNA